MKKQKRIDFGIFKVIVCVLLCLLLISPSFAGFMFAKAEDITEIVYTDVLEDLQKDSSFDVSLYPVIEDNYSLQVIQIAESVNNELFIYVYQPNQDFGKYIASSINISPSLHDKRTIKNYTLSLLNFNGVFQKYLVDDFVVADSDVRYYEVISIYRPFDKDIDEGLDDDNENTIDEVVFKVAKQYTVGNTSENGIQMSVADTVIDTIEITDKYVGYVRYLDGWHFFPSNYEACDSHFIAFSTDIPIDKLFDIEVYYTTQGYMNYMMPPPIYDIDTIYGEEIPSYAYINFRDHGSYSGDGLFGYSYKWDLIQTVDDFIESENNNRDNMFSIGIFDVGVDNKLTDEGLQDLEDMQWVVRFAETEYVHVTTTGSYMTSRTIVGDVSVLRLSFESGGTCYQLPVIDNKQTEGDDPDNIQKPTIRPNIWFYILFIILVCILLIILLWPFMPVILSFLWMIVKGIFKAIWWLITAPFSIFNDE